MKENSPGDNSQEIVKVSKEEIVERITITRNVTHVIEEDKGLPETVGLVDQLTDLIMLVVERREGVVLAAQWTRVRLSQCLNVLAHLLEAVAENEANQIKVRHGEHVNACHEEDPDALDADPGDKETEGVLVHVLVGRQCVQHSYHASGAENDQIVDDYGHLSSTFMVVRVVLGRSNRVRLHLLHRDKGNQPGEL